MAEVFVARSGDMPEGARNMVEHEGRQIGVVRAKGKLHAFLNICPHQGRTGLRRTIDSSRRGNHRPPTRPIRACASARPTLHIVCPWHGWNSTSRPENALATASMVSSGFRPLSAMEPSMSLSEASLRPPR